MLNSFFLWLMSLFMREKSCSKGSSMIMGTIIAAVIVGALALKSTGMTDLSFASFSSAGDVTIAQEYALSRAESMRSVKYSDLADVPLSKISDSDGFYEEVSLSDSFLNAFVSGSNIGVSGKNIDVKIYKGDGEDRKLCTTLSLNRVDPVSFDSEINMVTNDSDSDSLYKAMSADAFKDLVDSKVTDDKNSESDNLCLSASALKEYLKDKLQTYSKTSDSVWYDGNSAVGSDYQGVYVKATGEVLPGSVVYRGNVTNNPHALIIVPFLGSDNIWHYDFVDRANLYTKFIDQLYFTFTITQSPNQTITVTTDDGLEHTESFTVKYGTNWTAKISAIPGFQPGVLSASSGTVHGNTFVSATDAVPDIPPGSDLISVGNIHAKISWSYDSWNGDDGEGEDNSYGMDVDSTIFILAADGKFLSGSGEFKNYSAVWFGNLNYGGYASLDVDDLYGGTSENLYINLASTPADVQTFLILVNCYDADTRGYDFGTVNDGKITIYDSSNNKELCSYTLGGNYNAYQGVVVAKIYRHPRVDGVWVFEPIDNPLVKASDPEAMSSPYKR